MHLDTVFAVLSTLGWIGSALFLAVYHHSSRWWEHGYGRSLFFLGIVAFLFFTASMLRNLFGGDYPGRAAIRSINLVLGVSMVWYLLYTLVRNGVTVRRTRRQEDLSAVREPR